MIVLTPQCDFKYWYNDIFISNQQLEDQSIALSPCDMIYAIWLSK